MSYDCVFNFCNTFSITKRVLHDLRSIDLQVINFFSIRSDKKTSQQVRGRCKAESLFYNFIVPRAN